MSIEYIKMMDNQMRSIISVTVHLSGVPKVLYSTVLWLCECSGLTSALSLECLASRYLYHILKSVLPCRYSCFLIEYRFCGCSSDNGIQVLFLLCTVAYIYCSQ